MSARLAVVVDTNSLVRAALDPGSAAGRLVAALLDPGDLVASLETLAEMEEVLARRKFAGRLPDEVRRRFVRRVALGALVVQPEERMAECRDPRDDKFLAAALAADAAMVVSDDRDRAGSADSDRAIGGVSA